MNDYSIKAIDTANSKKTDRLCYKTRNPLLYPLLCCVQEPKDCLQSKTALKIYLSFEDMRHKIINTASKRALLSS